LINPQIMAKKKWPWDDDEDDDEKPKKPKVEYWKVVKDLLEQTIVKNGDWQTAEIIAELEEMINIFRKQYPEVIFSVEDLRLALHDLNIDYERNEHNDRFYYLANWK